MAKFLMVLNDGQTYTDLAGCRILRVEGDEVELDDGEIPADAEPVARFETYAAGVQAAMWYRDHSPDERMFPLS